jgi:hypothetical protein
MPSTPSPGPAWLGIGAQRSGTTWLTDLIVQHPQLDVGMATKKGKYRPVKEHQYLHRLAEGVGSEDEYRARFDGEPEVALGEWTPFYLAALSVPHVARRVCRDDAPFFAVLRDPVDRFASARRLWMQRPNHRGSLAQSMARAQWLGCYADQLDGWARVVGRERMLVLGFETARDDPATACGQMWDRVGLAPVELKRVDEPSGSSSKHEDWRWPEGLQDQLVHLYADQVRRVRDDWGVDVSRWRNFADVV